MLTEKCDRIFLDQRKINVFYRKSELYVTRGSIFEELFAHPNMIKCGARALHAWTIDERMHLFMQRLHALQD